MSSLAENELEDMGRKAAMAWIQRDYQTLNEAAAHHIKQAGRLTRDEMERVTHYTNRHAYLAQHNKMAGEHRYVKFHTDPARVDEVIKQATGLPEPVMYRSLDDYSKPPEDFRKKASWEELFGVTHFPEPAIERLDPFFELNKIGSQVIHAIKQAQSDLDMAEVELDGVKSRFVQEMKTAHADGASLGDLVRVLGSINPDPAMVKAAFSIAYDDLVRSGRHSPQSYFASLKTASAVGSVNPDHPLAQAYRALSETSEKVAAIRLALEDLEKKAGVWGTARGAMSATNSDRRKNRRPRFQRQRPVGIDLPESSHLPRTDLGPPSPTPLPPAPGDAKVPATPQVPVDPAIPISKPQAATVAPEAPTPPPTPAVPTAAPTPPTTGEAPPPVTPHPAELPWWRRGWEGFKAHGAQYSGWREANPYGSLALEAGAAVLPAVAVGGYYALKDDPRKQNPQVPTAKMASNASAPTPPPTPIAESTGSWVGSGVRKGLDFFADQGKNVSQHMGDFGASIGGKDSIPHYLGRYSGKLVQYAPHLAAAGLGLRAWNHAHALRNSRPVSTIASFIPGTDEYERKKLEIADTYGAYPQGYGH